MNGVGSLVAYSTAAGVDPDCPSGQVVDCFSQNVNKGLTWLYNVATHPIVDLQIIYQGFVAGLAESPEPKAQQAAEDNQNINEFITQEGPYLIPGVGQLLSVRDIVNAEVSGHPYRAFTNALLFGASAGLGDVSTGAGLISEDSEGTNASETGSLSSGDVIAAGDGSSGSLGGGNGNILDSGSSSSNSNWVQNLVINRSVAAPENLNLSHLSDVKNFLVAELGIPAKWIDNRTTIAILEQDGTWYLGLSNSLDLWTQTRLRLRGFVPSDTPIRILDTYPGFGDYHAEPNALNELWNSGASGNEASMVVSRQPCRLCIETNMRPYDGTIKNGVIATGMSSLTLQFVRKIASRLDNNPLTILP